MLQFDVEKRPIQEKKPGKPAIDPQAVEDCRKVIKGLRGVAPLQISILMQIPRRESSSRGQLP